MSKATEHIGLLAAVIGLITALLTLATQLGSFGDVRIPGLPGAEVSDNNPFGSCNPAAIRPELSLSTGRGPSGTELTVRGSDFCPDERVEVSLHTEQIAVAETGADGTFSVPARIPGTFDAFAPSQFDIIARGKFGHARTPFPADLRVAVGPSAMRRAAGQSAGSSPMTALSSARLLTPSLR